MRVYPTNWINGPRWIACQLVLTISPTRFFTNDLVLRKARLQQFRNESFTFLIRFRDQVGRIALGGQQWRRRCLEHCLANFPAGQESGLFGNGQNFVQIKGKEDVTVVTRLRRHDVLVVCLPWCTIP